jgi:hypothetical protein
MIVRHALNFAAHLVAGMAFGALAVTTYRALKRRQKDDRSAAAQLDAGDETVEPA